MLPAKILNLMFVPDLWEEDLEVKKSLDTNMRINQTRRAHYWPACHRKVFHLPLEELVLMEHNNSGQRFTLTKPTAKSMKDDSGSHRKFVQVPFLLLFSLFVERSI